MANPKHSRTNQYTCRSTNYKKKGTWGWWRTSGEVNVLSSEGLVVHQKKLNIGGVLDEESFVSRVHPVLGLLVGAISDL